MTSSLLQEKKKEHIGRIHTFSDIKHGSLLGFLPHFIASFEMTLTADVSLQFTWMLQETLMTLSSTQHLCNFSIVKQRGVYYTLHNTELRNLSA